MNRKWIYSISAVSLLALTTAACSSSTPSDKTTSSEVSQTESADASSFKTVTPGVLTVASVIPFPGFMEGSDADSVNGGLDWALSEELAKRFGLDSVQYKNVDFAALTAGQVPDYDLGIVEIYVTDARKAVNQYSNCYRNAYLMPIVKKGLPFATPEDVAKIQWAVQTGSDGENTLINYVPDAEYKSYPSVTQIGELILKNQQVEGIFAGTEDVGPLIANPDIQKNYDIPAKVVTSDAPEGSCIAIQLPKDSPNLSLVNDELSDILDKGLMHEWEEKYVPGGFVDVTKLPTITLTK